MTRLISSMRFSNALELDSIDRFEPDDIFYHWDVLYQDKFRTITSAKGFPKYIVEDSSCDLEIDGYKILASPEWAKFENKRMLKEIHLLAPNEIETRYAFNFMINKKQINRYLTMKLVEIFGFESYDYTWSGFGQTFDLTQLFDEIDLCDPDKNIMYDWLRLQLGNPISLPKKFIDFPDPEINDVAIASYGSNIASYGNNIWTWNNGLNDLFSYSGISLVSEPIKFEKGSPLSEKTLYAMYGLTFPIWLGGYGMPDAMVKLGFDIFDDIIDHSYQYKSSLFERCYQAIRFNEHLLKDVKLVRELRKKHMDRLTANRESLQNGFFDNKMQDRTQNWPPEVISMMNSIRFFQGGCH